MSAEKCSSAFRYVAQIMPKKYRFDCACAAAIMRPQRALYKRRRLCCSQRIFSHLPEWTILPVIKTPTRRMWLTTDWEGYIAHRRIRGKDWLSHQILLVSTRWKQLIDPSEAEEIGESESDVDSTRSEADTSKFSNPSMGASKVFGEDGDSQPQRIGYLVGTFMGSRGSAQVSQRQHIPCPAEFTAYGKS